MCQSNVVVLLQNVVENSSSDCVSGHCSVNCCNTLHLAELYIFQNIYVYCSCITNSHRCSVDFIFGLMCLLNVPVAGILILDLVTRGLTPSFLALGGLELNTVPPVNV